MSRARTSCLAAALLIALSPAAFATFEVRGPALDATPAELPPADVKLDAEGTRILDEISALRRQAAGNSDEQKSADLRATTLRGEAFSYGMRAGLAWRYRRIEALLKQREPQIDAVFNFNRVLYDGVALPPVVSVFEDGYRLIDGDTARLTRVGYRIELPARLVMTAPTWREFLVKHYPDPEKPSWIILPKNDDESVVWKENVALGWTKGVRQADLIYEASLALLTRTLRGMLTFHELVTSGMVSPPVVARTDRGVVLEGKQLNVGDVLYRLTSQPAFQKPETWKPAVQANEPR